MSTVSRSSARTARRTRRFDKDPMRKVFLRFLLVAVVLGAGAYVAFSSYNGVPGRSYDYRTAAVPRVGNLLGHDPVRIAGRRIGQVKSIKTAPDGAALVRMQLEKGNPLPVDTKIVLRANGLLGARYVELIPGRSTRMLGPDDVLRGGKDSLTYGVPETLDVFDKETRGGLHATIGGLGQGLLGQGQTLNDAIREGSHAIGPFDQLLADLSSNPQPNERLLPNLDGMMQPLDANRDALGDLFAATPKGLQPLVDRRTAVRDTLTQAPGALRAADAGLGRSLALLGAARDLATAASRTLPDAPASLRATTALLKESPQPLRRAKALLDAAQPAIPAALKITSGARPLLDPLHDLFGTLSPIVTTVAPYQCDIQNFGAVFRSMTGMGGQGEGPNGQAMEFRLQAVAPVPAEALSTTDHTGLLHRDGYSPPCKFLAGPYDRLGDLVGKGK